MESIIKEKLNNFFSFFNGEYGREEEEAQLKGKSKIIGVYGTQGGVGTSSFITQLSTNLVQKGYKTLVIDGDFLTPYHYCKYEPKRDNISLRTYLYNNDIEEMSKLLVKDSSGVEYLQVTPISVLDILNFNQEDKFELLRRTLNKLYEFYHIILIDLNLDLSFIYIEQSFIKEVQLLIEIGSDSLSSKLNKDTTKDIIFNTIKDVPIFKIQNKCENEEEKNSLPYAKKFSYYEKMGICYLFSDDVSKDIYVNKFNNIQQQILKILGY